MTVQKNHVTRKNKVEKKSRPCMIATMKRFHTQLNILMDKHLLTKAALAKKVEADASSISRLAVGSADCSADLMGRIAHCFPRDDALRLLAAWVEDKAEEGGFTVAQLRASLGSADGLHVLPGLRDDLALILSRGANLREFRAIVSNLAALLRPSAEDTHHAAEGPGPTDLPKPKPVTYGKRPRT